MKNKQTILIIIDWQIDNNNNNYYYHCIGIF